MIIADRVKATLSADCLRHILSVEAGNENGWLEYDKLAVTVDTYDSNHWHYTPVVGGALSGAGINQTRTGEKKFVGQPNRAPMADRSNGVSAVSVTKLKQCYRCHNYDHLVAQCKAPTPGQSPNGQVRSQYKRPGEQHNPRAPPPPRVTRVIAERSHDVGANETEPTAETVTSRKTTESKAAAGDVPTADVRRCMVQREDGQHTDVIHDLHMSPPASPSSETLKICNGSGFNPCIDQPINNSKPADTHFTMSALSSLS